MPHRRLLLRLLVERLLTVPRLLLLWGKLLALRCEVSGWRCAVGQAAGAVLWGRRLALSCEASCWRGTEGRAAGAVLWGRL